MSLAYTQMLLDPFWVGGSRIGPRRDVLGWAGLRRPLLPLPLPVPRQLPLAQ
jgi:hypothetical protein